MVDAGVGPPGKAAAKSMPSFYTYGIVLGEDETSTDPGYDDATEVEMSPLTFDCM